MNAAQVAAAWAHAQYSWIWTPGMRVLALKGQPSRSEDPAFIEQVRRAYIETCPVGLDPNDLFKSVLGQATSFPRLEAGLTAPDEEDWRVVEVGILPDGNLPYFSAQRTTDGAQMDFAMMGPTYYLGEIKSDGHEQWFVGQTGPIPIPDLEDWDTLILMGQAIP